MDLRFSKPLLYGLRLLFLSLAVYMTGVAVVTSLESNLFEEWNALAAIPWMRATLIDFYFNILIISAWVIYRENLSIRSLIWVLSFVLLGSIATAFYVFIQLCRARSGDLIGSVLIKRGAS